MSSLLEQCKQWYGPVNGTYVYERSMAAQAKYEANPTVINIPPRDVVFEAKLALRILTSEQRAEVLKEFGDV